MRTRDRKYCQTIRSVRDISRDDRARIATSSLRTPTDRQTTDRHTYGELQYRFRIQLHTSSRSRVEFDSWRLREKLRDIGTVEGGGVERVTCFY